MDPAPLDIQTPSLIPPDDPHISHPQLVQIPFFRPSIRKSNYEFLPSIYTPPPGTSKKITYLSADFQDHRAGVAQKSLALHSAWLVCVRLLSGGRNAFIFDFCLRATIFCG
jgi:hypothetical protein